MRRILLFVLPALVLLAGCGEETNPTGSGGVDGASLLGLADGRELRYLQIDTTITIDSTYRIETNEMLFTVGISGADNDWYFDYVRQPEISIKLSSESVLLNGYRRYDDTTVDVRYFTEPPCLIPRTLTINDEWSGYTPSYTSPSGPLRLPAYFANFGFYFTKVYVGTELIVVPAGEFAAHRFDTELFINPLDTVPVATVTEYYVQNKGLARLRFQGGGLVRLLTLVNNP